MTRRRGPAPSVVVGLALLAVVGALSLVPAAALPRQVARAVAVTVAQAVCPDVRSAPPALRTRVSAGVVPGERGEGQVDARALSGGEPDDVSLSAPGQAAGGLAPDLDGDALVVAATGGLAPGLEVEQVTRGASGTQRGLAGLRCDPPATDLWWLGGGTVVGDAAVLLLVDPDDTPAEVDVEVLTTSGPADPRPGRGVVVAARGRTAVALDRLAPDRDVLGVHVVATRGRVAGGVRTVRTDGAVPRGVDWVPQAGAPATTVLVPGLPAGPGRRSVLVANPGPDDTTVSVELTTGEGQLVPPGLEAVAVPARTTVPVEVTGALASTPAAVRVRSAAGPVLAAGQLLDAQYRADGLPDGPVRETAYAGAGQELSGPALLAGVALDRPTEATLLLSALDAGARVQVAPLPLAGDPAPTAEPLSVDVPGGRTVAVRLSTLLPEGAEGSFAVEVRPEPGSGPVLAARYLRERGETGPLSTLLTLRAATPDVRRPAVRADPLAGATG